jgi:uncharacterized protein (TIGR02145 family)
MNSINEKMLLKPDIIHNNVNGITYFKLISPFEGDYTKNCGLLGSDVDKNFYYLRGNDIKSIEIKDNNIIIYRVDENYPPLIANIPVKNEYKFNFNKEKGILTITYPDGNIQTLDGFVVNCECEEITPITLITDNTISGSGDIYDPLRISSMEKTGMLSPVDEFIDLTNNEILPNNAKFGYRVLTKERTNDFGLLYPYEALAKIKETLLNENSEWRIPTKDDWDELLNSLEIFCENSDHDSEGVGTFGDVAASALKTNALWVKQDNPVDVDIIDGSNKAGTTVYPVGCKLTSELPINAAVGFSTGMWCDSYDETGKAYVKIFSYDTNKVHQELQKENALFSIRLVKDYTGENFNEFETIPLLGQKYPTVLVKGICQNVNYEKIWTALNFYSPDNNYNGVTLPEWNNVLGEDDGARNIYYINEWDGKTWQRKNLIDGDSIVIRNYSNLINHEYRIIKSELVDVFLNTNIVIEGVNDSILNLVNDLNAHSLDNNIHITNSERIEWNSIEGKSRKYTDEKIDSAVTISNNYTDNKVDETLNASKRYTNSEIKKLPELYASKTVVDNLINNDTDKSIRTIATEEVAKIIANANDDFDTLKEIADWIVNDKIGATQMSNDITALKNINADTRLNRLEARTHSHGNKSVLDNITAENVNAWDAAEQNAKKYADSLSVNYDKKGDADSALKKAKEYTDEKETKIYEWVEAKRYLTSTNIKHLATKEETKNLYDFYDKVGSAKQAKEEAINVAQDYTDDEISNLRNVYDVKGSAVSAKTEAISSASSYTDSEIRLLRIKLTNSISSAFTSANTYTDATVKSLSGSIHSTLENYATKPYVEELIVSAVTDGKVVLTGYTTFEYVDNSKREAIRDAKIHTKNEVAIAIDSAKTYTDTEINKLDKTYVSKNDITSISAASHTHSNKSILDDITQEKLALLNDISALTASLKDLKQQLKDLNDNLNSRVNELVKEYINTNLIGNANEINVTYNEENEKHIIKFADDAIFGDIVK